MRILHVVADINPRQGGSTVACQGLARLMAGRGHSVKILTTDWGAPPLTRPAEDGIDIEALPLSWPKFLRISWTMRGRLPAAVAQADVVHLHSLYLFHDWAAGETCRRCNRPYIVEPHGTLDPFLYRRHRWRKFVADKLFQDAVLSRAAGLHYATREEWELARPYARNRRGAIVPLGIDISDYENLRPHDALRSRYPAIADRKVVLFLGRLSFKKGVDVVINAFRAATRQRDDAFLLIAGPDDGVRSDAEALVAALGLGSRAIFTGMVEGEEKRLILSGSDVFLLPSQSENFGITVIEAAACGIPVVMSNKVNLWRDFADDDAAVVGPPTAEEFARHLRALLDDPERAVQIGRRGAALVRRQFTWDALGQRYEDMYAAAAQNGTLPELS